MKINRKILRWIYKNNEPEMGDIIVQEFYGSIPSSLRSPAMDFLANGRNVLERFFSLQAYHIARRSIADTKNQSFYDGQLMFIKALILSVSKSSQNKVEPIPSEAENDPMEGVKDFISKVKESTKK
jgi:hypothetical protein